MKENRTDKDILIKGLQTLGICLALMFIGPFLLHVAFSNKEKPLYIPILIIAIIICGLAIFFAFRGIRIIMGSLFNKSTKKSKT